tara:strand:- start:56 stop:307 length:252 start_codon:yes stop_codon:yes gene_type:complete
LKNNKPYRSSGKPVGDGLTVEVRNGDIAGAMRRFKKKVQEAGIIQEFRDRQEFVKPSIKRAKAKKAARARWLKSQKKQDESKY